MKYSKVIAAALTLVCVTSALEAKHHRQIVAFGNSETDSGNMPADGLSPPFAPVNFALPPAPYSNGAVWVTQLGNYWGSPVTPSSKGGLNYATVAAQTSDDGFYPIADVFNPLTATHVPLGSLGIPANVTFIPSMTTQVEQFLTERRDVSKKAIIFHRGDANDLFFDPPPVDPVGDGALAARDTIDNLRTLKKAGYKNQVVFSGAAVTQPSTFLFNDAWFAFQNAFNASLLTGLKKVRLHPVVIDLTPFAADVLTNLPFYGFTGTGIGAFDPGLGPMLTQSGPNDTFFWFDGIHPSEKFHNLTAQYVYNILEAPECWAHLAAQPMAMMRNQNAVLRQQLYPIAELCEKQLYPFISGSYAPTEAAPFAGGKAHDTSGWNGTIGLAFKTLPHWTLGVAGSYNQNSFDDHHKFGKCEADIHAWVVSLLSGFQEDRGYLNAILNAGFVRYDDIERHFTIGPRKWKTHGDSHGMHYDVLVEGGWYFFRNEDCQFGPIATLEYQTLNIDRYDEHHASYNNLRYKSQHKHSFVTGLGLEALIWNPWRDTCASGFTMKIFLSANEDWANRTKHVQFRQRSLGRNAPYGKWPIYNERTFFGSGGISVTKTFDNGVILSTGYRGNWGQNHMNENSITANLTFPLWKHKKATAPATTKKPALK